MYSVRVIVVPRALLLFAMLSYTMSLSATDAMVASVPVAGHVVQPRESIAAYVNPAEVPDLSPAQLDAFVLRFATCTECWPLNVTRMASLGNRILGSLARVCAGDDRFLDTQTRQQSFEAIYYRLAPYMSPRIEKSAYVQAETDKLKHVARSRASEVLLAIGTPDARAIACGKPVG